MHDVGATSCDSHGQVCRNHLERRAGCCQVRPRLVRDRTLTFSALAVHGQVDVCGQRAGKVFHVDTSAAVNLGRVLPGQHRNSGSNDVAARTGHCGTFWPLPTTVMPASETTKPLARSCSLSTPTTAPSGTSTFLS